MFAEAIEDILRNHCAPAQVRAVESGASPQPLIAELEAAGFFALMAPESQGGGGASWRDLHDIVVLAGTWSVPIPLAQTLAMRAMVDNPETLPPGATTFAPVLVKASDGSLSAPQVPSARTSTHVAGVMGDTCVLLPVTESQARLTGVHGSQAANLHWTANTNPRTLKSRISAERFQSIAALLHAGLMAGAMKRAFNLTMAYANDRVQFGKSIGKFQAIQHNLAVMAEHVAAAGMASEAAFAAGNGDVPPFAACAVAKARTSEAAAQVAAIAHAVHGAIGITEEYDLQLSTRRLHEWRMAHGSETHWHRELGQLFLDSPAASSTDFVRTLL